MMFRCMQRELMCSTLKSFLAGVFGLAAGGASSWLAVCSLYACVGLGIGGNLPVDGALFLEFIPFASGNLLTLLSVWWPIGNLFASMIAWALIGNFSCDPHLPSCIVTSDIQPCCGKHNNWGWRYFVLAIGSLTICMTLCRSLLFRLFESPKFLLSRGKQAEAVAVVHGIAHYNRTTTCPKTP